MDFGIVLQTDPPAWRVVELAKQREVIETAQRLDAAWRAGLKPSPASFRRLIERLGRWS